MMTSAMCWAFFYGLTGSGHSYRELEDEAKLIKNEILKVKDVAKVEIYGTQTPTNRHFRKSLRHGP